jgi:hypothetical protein
MTITTPSLSSSRSTSRPEEEPELRSAGLEAAALIKENRLDLAEEWSRRIRSSESSSYSQLSFEILRKSCEECLQAFEAVLEREDTDPLWRFVDRICQERAELQFPPADVIEAFTYFMDAADDVVGPQASDLDSWREISAAWRGVLRKVIRSFVNSYWIHLEMAQNLL